MNVIDKAGRLPRHLTQLIAQIYDSENSDVAIEETITSDIRITIEIKPDMNNLIFEGLSSKDLEASLDDLKRRLEIVYADEPENEDSKDYEDWGNIVMDLKKQIDNVQNAIYDLSA